MMAIDIENPGADEAALVAAINKIAFPWLGQDEATTTGLTYGYKAGKVRHSALGVQDVAAGTIVCDPNAETYVWAEQDDVDEEVAVNSGVALPNGTFAMAKLTTGEEAIESIEDLRSLILVAPQFCQAVSSSTIDAGTENISAGTFAAAFNVLVASGGTTPTKNLPSASALAAKAVENGWRWPAGNTGACILRVVNKNSGDLTLVGGADTDTGGATLVIATNKFRDYAIVVYPDDPFGAEISNMGMGDA